MDRIIGLDLGSKTCGVSICDALHITCRALTTVRFESDDYDACLEEVLKLLQENKVKEVTCLIVKILLFDESFQLWFQVLMLGIVEHQTFISFLERQWFVKI